MTDSFVPKSPQLPATPPPPVVAIDPARVVRDAFTANGQLVDGLLRSIAPAPPPVDGDGVTGTYSTPAESRERTRRFSLSVGAIVVIALTSSGGLVSLAWHNGVVDGVSGVGWLLIGFGTIMGALVAWLMRQDYRHSAEGIAHAREDYRAVVDQVDAESRHEVASAMAYAIRIEADAKARTVAAQADALDAEVRRLSAPKPEPRRLVITTPDGEYPVHTPVATPVAPPVGKIDTPVASEACNPVSAPCSTPVPSCPPLSPASGENAVVVYMLGWVASLYEPGALRETDSHRLVVVGPVPWSARSDAFDGDTKERIKTAMLSRGNPPLFEIIQPGNQPSLHPMYVGRKRPALAMARAVLS